MVTKLCFKIDKNHPSLMGHFPGNPIIPGVVILQQVLNLFKQAKSNTSINEISKVKFIQLMEIDTLCELQFKEIHSGRFNFSIFQNNLPIVTGNIRVK